MNNQRATHLKVPSPPEGYSKSNGTSRAQSVCQFFDDSQQQCWWRDKEIDREKEILVIEPQNMSQVQKTWKRSTSTIHNITNLKSQLTIRYSQFNIYAYSLFTVHNSRYSINCWIQETSFVIDTFVCFLCFLGRQRSMNITILGLSRHIIAPNF